MQWSPASSWLSTPYTPAIYASERGQQKIDSWIKNVPIEQKQKTKIYKQLKSQGRVGTHFHLCTLNL